MLAILVIRRPDGLLDLLYQSSKGGIYPDQDLTLAEAQDRARRNLPQGQPQLVLVCSTVQAAVPCENCDGKGTVCKPVKGGVECSDCPPCRNSGFVVKEATMTPTCSRCDSGLTKRYAIIDGENQCLPCVMDWAVEQRETRAARAVDCLPDIQGLDGAKKLIEYRRLKDCEALTAAGAILRSLQLEGD